MKDSIEALYKEVVLEHFRRPRNRNPLDSPDGSALVVNPLCGDQVRVEVELSDGRVSSASARTRGCSIAVAAGSVMTELVRGMELEAIARLSGELERVVRGEDSGTQLDERLRAFARVADLPSRQRCALLPWEALEEALEQAG
ncbi:MAG: SUF system NifU family Fe-S cluster assembly protein [Myxococcota bacterium]